MEKSLTNSKRFVRLILYVFLIGTTIFSAFIVLIIFLGYFEAKKTKSYIPVFNKPALSIKQNEKSILELKSIFYLLSIDAQGGVIVKTPEGSVIMSGLLYYANHKGMSEKWGLDDISIKLINDTTVSIRGNGSSGSIVNILLTVPKKEPELDVSIKTVYKSASVVYRESLVAGFEVPVSEIYRKNGRIEFDSLDSEYWLNRQGLRFGSGSKSALVYHPSGVSSLQLDSKRNLLYVNLEYFMDHPHIHIPYQEGSGERGIWEDQSMAIYRAGQVRKNDFCIHFNSLPPETPRLMLVPSGYLAGYVFTEHADGGNIGSHRAVYFGSDTVKNIANAVGGFVGNRIPVTKSIFYADPVGEKRPTIRDDPDYPQYLDFLDQLKSTGLYEICLHTPENFTSNRELLDESIKFMKDRYDAVTWIDHGMYGGKLNRESFVADGLDSTSEYFAADLWEKYDTRYFWNTAEEMNMESISEKIKKYRPLDASFHLWSKYLSSTELQKTGFLSAFSELIKRYNYNGETNSLLPVKGSAYPNPIYYQHITRTRLFYSWATYKSTNYTNLWTGNAENQYVWDLEQVEKLVDDRGIYINHGYYIGNRPNYDATEELEGQVLLNQYFERMLEHLAKLRDKGDLYISTIRDLLDYWIMTENISFKYLPDGLIAVNNNNDKPVYGLSMAVKSSDILVNGKTPKYRKSGDDIIFWFDIDPGEIVLLSLHPVSD